MSSPNNVAGDMAGMQGHAAEGHTAANNETMVDVPSTGVDGSDTARTADEADTNLSDGATSATSRSNRFSISFPIQTPTTLNLRPQSPTRIIIVNKDPETVLPVAGPMDTNFLTAIAAQERRVLELKEELVRAEAELGRLKRQWTQHEAQKKRNEVKSLTQMQPVAALPLRVREDDANGSSAWMQAEMERRKVMIKQTRPGGRTVFAGSKHTRALSLLSSAQDPQAAKSGVAHHPPRSNSLVKTSEELSDAPPARPETTSITRAATTPNLMAAHGDVASIDKSIDREILLKTGKKMASDFRDGLWTFWEDLRQATVGEDGVSDSIRISPPSRQRPRQPHDQTRKDTGKRVVKTPSRESISSTTSSRAKKSTPGKVPNKNTMSSMSMATAPALADPSFWTDHGLTSHPKSPSTVRKSGKIKAGSIDDASSDAAWDTWDDISVRAHSPKPSPSSSVASDTNTLPTTASEGTSPRISIDTSGIHSRQPSEHPIPWPSLSSIGPKALRRSASHLMSEWEKTMAPETSPDFTSDGESIGLQAKNSAADRAATKQD